MENHYPAGPSDVPAGFTRPGASYRRKAWLAVAGLITFIVLYLALTVWFAWTGINRLLALNAHSGPLDFLVCACSLFLTVFLVKALFFIKKGDYAGVIELKRAEQPGLFAFLDQVADDAGAPRPHKVFVSGRVNAAVFYDLSLVNLVFPSRKNLEIGLGLVNMLNLSEFKAVCAHEFGHFAQRSMALGRWVYTTQQIAAHIVGKRDALDGFLRQLSHFDIRVAWIGWGLSLIVWALRSIVDTGFRLVMIVQRALSREMEMQADLVAVSLTGSDALIHALHRLQVADDAWERAVGFVRGEAGAERPPRDVFVVQQAIATRLGQIYNDPAYGQRPQVPVTDAAAFRVFKAELAQPPRMWATHPQNHEREENAKRTYLASPEDTRSAWTLFEDAPAMRERMTRELIGETELAVVEPDVTLQRLDDQFAIEPLKPHYRGIYLGFPITRHAARADELYAAVPADRTLDPDTLYPASISQDLEALRALDHEHALLRSLRDGVYTAADGVIRHRGRILKHSELQPAIDSVAAERTEIRARLATLLKQVRSLHQAHAGQLSTQWQAYLKGLLHVLHYAHHAEAELRDTQAALARSWHRASASGSVNARGIKVVLASAEAVQRALVDVFGSRDDVHPGERVLAELGHENWSAMLGALGLGNPVRENIGDWLRVADSWVNHAAGCLSRLGRVALAELLQAEASIAAATRGEPLPDAPAGIPSAPPAYTTLVVDTERFQRIENPDFWERFRSASGFLPGLARAGVAVGIVGAVLVFGWSLDESTVTVYNPLARTVVATVDGKTVTLAPDAHASIDVHAGRDITVTARAQDGDPIDAFQASIDRADNRIVYTIAGAAPLRQWSAVYGAASAEPPRLLPPQRWQPAITDVVFAAPPASIKTKGGGAIRTVLDSGDDMAPAELVEQLKDNAAAAPMLLSHVRFDAPDSARLNDWLQLASTVPGFDDAFAARRTRFPIDVVAMRFEQVAAKDSAARAAVCARQRTLADTAPDQPDLAYLVTRCMPAGPAQDAAFDAGHRRWPDSAWFANAAGWNADLQGRYRDALTDYETALAGSPALREYAAVELLRMARVVDPDAARSRAASVAAQSATVRGLLVYEPGDTPPAGAYQPLALLAGGRLDDAVAASAGTPAHAHVLRMAAASSGASAALRTRAQSLAADDGVDPYTAILALAMGSPASTPAIQARLSTLATQYEIPDLSARLNRFLTLARHGDTTEAARALDGLPALLRAQALVAGIYVMKDRAPDAWRTFARRALFAVERPYLG
ncbi:MAG: M48 family metalloprotease [Burkholderia sp.]|jgi:Zn-dependent protease with chaperone function|uniref:M48 family metallopeptidase n=4 Tax=Pseudomonadota TaxID=1224 RepID=UPI002588A25E|nr:M48 family metallopeptidase [Burkholderia sp.]MCA3779418.1 M48 family metalloprotease [Burkholderia sp.]MCA3784456.1 M48 family metalloprotease [Burkholderia sp.]MCA3796616.1 M48 family metalloprotease [Burkholderia sp.]MCA3811624.1 M48 family metalloprotease [Burkholderia sp.]MCA3820795.1 M48 family metalloprotease [Burkholderia sp.]